MLSTFFVIALILTLSTASRVLELSDKFVDIKNEGGDWLVKFYAPWCGHCKRLEPVWLHVAQALHNTNIRVGRLDCTRFPKAAKAFAIAGFPTIKFIRESTGVMFTGDRNKDDIINFALRMSAPIVQDITNTEYLVELKNKNVLFFMYVGAKNGTLWETYLDIATKLQPHAFFYASNLDVANPVVDLSHLPVVFVHKDNSHHFYLGAGDFTELEDKSLNISLYKWVNGERFGTFPKITRGNFNEVVQTRKYIVMVVVEENKLQEVPIEMLQFRDMVETFAKENKDKFHEKFQFGWVGNPELANSIAMQVLPLPYLLVLNSTTNYHHVLEDDPLLLTYELLEEFLYKVDNSSLPHYGGNSWVVKTYRTYFEMHTSLAGMWKGNPVLTTVLFGLPLGFLTLILYSICCADILDADEDDEDHEKKE